jgi:hypothetical protein
MIRSLLYAVLFASLCPLLVAQQPSQAASTSATAQPDQTARQAAEAPPPSAVSERTQSLKSARTIYIDSQTDFLTVSTLERSLMMQKDWDKLGLNIVGNACGADLELQVNRVVFTHIHTYVLTDKASSIVLASGRVRALDGVVASGPMAEQIVKILAAARLPGGSTSSDPGF